MLAVHVETLGIHALGLLGQLEVDADVVLGDEPGAIGGTLELLLDGHVRDEVQVDVLGHVEHGPANKVGGVQRDIQMARETERLGIEGHEPQIHAGTSGHLHRVQQVVLVERRSQRRERADKALQEERDIVLENIHLAESLVEELLDALAREHLVHTGGLAAYQEGFLGLGVATVEDALQPLALADGQDGGARLEGIDKLAHEVEFAGLLALLAGLGSILVHGEDHALVAVVAEVIVAAGVVGVAAGDDLLHEVHGGIAAPLVALASGMDNHLVQGNGRGAQPDVQRAALADADLHPLRVVPHIRNFQHPAHDGRGQAVVSVHIGLCADCRPLPHQRGKGQAFAGDGVRHRAAQHRPLAEGRRSP